MRKIENKHRWKMVEGKFCLSRSFEYPLMSLSSSESRQVLSNIQKQSQQKKKFSFSTFLLLICVVFLVFSCLPKSSKIVCAEIEDDVVEGEEFRVFLHHSQNNPDFPFTRSNLQSFFV
jgi:hypothetical protein